MKRLLVLGLLVLGSRAGHCVEQYHSLGSVALSSVTFTGAVTLPQRTAAQLILLTAKTTGQALICSNCNVPFSLVISTGNTAPYQWILSTGTAAK